MQTLKEFIKYLEETLQHPDIIYDIINNNMIVSSDYQLYKYLVHDNLMPNHTFILRSTLESHFKNVHYDYSDMFDSLDNIMFTLLYISWANDIMIYYSNIEDVCILYKYPDMGRLEDIMKNIFNIDIYKYNTDDGLDKLKTTTSFNYKAMAKDILIKKNLKLL